MTYIVFIGRRLSPVSPSYNIIKAALPARRSSVNAEGDDVAAADLSVSPLAGGAKKARSPVVVNVDDGQNAKDSRGKNVSGFPSTPGAVKPAAVTVTPAGLMEVDPTLELLEQELLD